MSTHMYDDYGRLEPEVKVIPLPGGARILAGTYGFKREMDWRRLRNEELAPEARYPILEWETSETYFKNGWCKDA